MLDKCLYVLNMLSSVNKDVIIIITKEQNTYLRSCNKCKDMNCCSSQLAT